MFRIMVLAEQRGRASPIYRDLLHILVRTDVRAKEPTMATKNKAPKEILVVGSKVKDVIRDAGLRSDGELIQAVSDKVHELLGAAIERCKSNNRSTVRPYDL
jgi:hypothetical protein